MRLMIAGMLTSILMMPLTSAGSFMRVMDTFRFYQHVSGPAHAKGHSGPCSQDIFTSDQRCVIFIYLYLSYTSSACCPTPVTLPELASLVVPSLLPTPADQKCPTVHHPQCAHCHSLASGEVAASKMVSSTHFSKRNIWILL